MTRLRSIPGSWADLGFLGSWMRLGENPQHPVHEWQRLKPDRARSPLLCLFSQLVSPRESGNWLEICPLAAGGESTGLGPQAEARRVCEWETLWATAQNRGNRRREG